MEPTLRFIVRQMLERDDLCDISACERSIDIRDGAGDLTGREPCIECPRERLEADMRGPAGMLIRAAFDLEFAAEMKIGASAGEVAADEFAALKVIKQERATVEEDKRLREAAQRPRV